MDSHGRIFYIDHLHHTTTWLNPNNGVGGGGSGAAAGPAPNKSASSKDSSPGDTGTEAAASTEGVDGAVGGTAASTGSGVGDAMQPRDRQRQQLDQRFVSEYRRKFPKELAWTYFFRCCFSRYQRIHRTIASSSVSSEADLELGGGGAIGGDRSSSSSGMMDLGGGPPGGGVASSVSHGRQREMLIQVRTCVR